MNMRLPDYLVESDPLLTNVPQLEGVMEVTTEAWTAEELENAERQAEEVLLEEAFLEACFEEMLEEEESQWFHYTVTVMPSVMYTTHMPTLPYASHVQGVQYTTNLSPTQHVDAVYSGNTMYYQCLGDCNAQTLNLSSKLNPEAPEFVPRGIAL